MAGEALNSAMNNGAVLRGEGFLLGRVKLKAESEWFCYFSKFSQLVELLPNSDTPTLTAWSSSYKLQVLYKSSSVRMQKLIGTNICKSDWGEKVQRSCQLQPFSHKCGCNFPCATAHTTVKEENFILKTGSVVPYVMWIYGDLALSSV